ncbi:Prolyl oligopeptidase family protein [Variovorax sp. OK212]|nr:MULTISPECIES: prolyl oligopeptidase family serine peptidase [unclassified Variovorax]SEJ97934.1 Prolyl oligopeptidase family protein [Variovorax sp. OK202]SFD23400.1 Prolyl oligopeptidase family protein [Variovorax sp. OK212]
MQKTPDSSTQRTRRTRLNRPASHAALAALAGTTVLLAACGGGGGGGGGGIGVGFPPPVADTGRGSVVTNPPEQTASLTADQFNASLQGSAQGKTLLQIAGTPKCGVTLRSLEYRTIGAKNEATNATAAIMVPTGSDVACGGQRPVVLYAHGTTAARNYNLAKWTDATQAAAGEGLLVAAMFAAQGYIVVAPNYAGYDKSTLPYHPYLDGDQQGKDMVDALTAARKTFSNIGANDAGSLFITGYSQGGYVAMAAHREMQATGKAVTASAPLSAPSAISLLTDYTYQGWPALGATLFVPLLSTSWQQQFGNVYNATTDIYESQYANGIDTLLPSLTPDTLFSSGKLPQLALFPPNATPGPVNSQLAIFYGANNLIRQSFLTQAATDIQSNPCPGNALPPTAASLSTAAPLNCAPSTGFRKAAVANDLRNWVPTRPMLMCGGANDPTVNFISTRATSGYFRAKGVPASALTVVDLEDSAAIDAYSNARAGFAQAKDLLAQGTSGSAADKAQAVTLAYHGTLAPPFCLASARGFFQGVLAAGG